MGKIAKCMEVERIVVESACLNGFAKMYYVALRSFRGKADVSKLAIAERAGQAVKRGTQSLKELKKMGLVKEGSGKNKNGYVFGLIDGSEEEQKELLAKLKEVEATS